MEMIMAIPKRPRKKVIPLSLKQPSFSVFDANPAFVKKIQSRESFSGSGDDLSPGTDSFRASVTVPFQWESRPGEPINPPEKTEDCPPSQSYADSPPPSSSLAPSAAVRPASSRVRARCFLKKLVSNGGKLRGDNHDKKCGSSSSRGSSKTQGFSWGCIKSGF